MMQRDYQVAVGLYVIATIMTGLPGFGIIQFDLPLSYPAL
jgi:hypothetical protein